MGRGAIATRRWEYMAFEQEPGGGGDESTALDDEDIREVPLDELDPEQRRVILERLERIEEALREQPPAADGDVQDDEYALTDEERRILDEYKNSHSGM